MSDKTVQLDGIDIRVEKVADGNITAEPVGPTSITEVAEHVREIVLRKNTEQDVDVKRGKVRVDGAPLYTDELNNIKELGLSLSYVSPGGKLVFVHDSFGQDEYVYAFGSDASSQA